MRSQVYSTAGEMACFAIPNDCNVIWVSGCGGGGGGGGGNSASGATGGGASPYFFRVPLTVNAGGAIMVHVGVGGAGGASGGSGASFSSENYVRCSAVVGRDILSPLIMPYTYALYLGYGSNGWQTAGGGTGLPETIVVNTANVNRLNPTNVNAADWSYAANTFHAFVMPPSVTGDAGRAGPSNPYAYGVAGFATFNDMGLGPESASDATYGSGGAGGGGLFGRGGAGGVYSGGPGDGGDGTGYGSGGGGGSGGVGPYGAGGDGAGGLVVIEY